MSERTPTQELILEVLTARHRLGETLWTFSTQDGAALRALETAGLIWTMNGIVEHTIRASLTVDGLRQMIPDGSTYKSPLEERFELALAQLKELRYTVLLGAKYPEG